MSSSFLPRLDILPVSQLALWPELDAVQAEFVLYGGTALALQLGHRASEDFGFFSSIRFEPELLYDRLPFLNSLDRSNPASWVHFKRHKLEGYVERQGSSVKLAFFGGLDTLRRVQNPAHPVGSQIWVASLVDLAG